MMVPRHIQQGDDGHEHASVKANSPDCLHQSRLIQFWVPLVWLSHVARLAPCRTVLPRGLEVKAWSEQMWGCTCTSCQNHVVLRVPRAGVYAEAGDGVQANTHARIGVTMSIPSCVKSMLMRLSRPEIARISSRVCPAASLLAAGGAGSTRAAFLEGDPPSGVFVQFLGMAVWRCVWWGKEKPRFLS